MFQEWSRQDWFNLSLVLAAIIEAGALWALVYLEKASEKQAAETRKLQEATHELQKSFEENARGVDIRVTLEVPLDIIGAMWPSVWISNAAAGGCFIEAGEITISVPNGGPELTQPCAIGGARTLGAFSTAKAETWLALTSIRSILQKNYHLMHTQAKIKASVRYISGGNMGTKSSISYATNVLGTVEILSRLDPME